MTPRDAERALALEFVAVLGLRTLHGFTDDGGLLGPQQYAAMLASFAMLSVLVMYGPTAQLAAILGLILVLAVALRPSTGADGSPSTAGADTAGAIGRFARNVGSSAPSLAKGVT